MRPRSEEAIVVGCALIESDMHVVVTFFDGNEMEATLTVETVNDDDPVGRIVNVSTDAAHEGDAIQVWGRIINLRQNIIFMAHNASVRSANRSP
jgi:hypothetical protein